MLKLHYLKDRKISNQRAGAKGVLVFALRTYRSL